MALSGAVTVVGAGGIGCALGHACCVGGMRVTMVETAPDKLAWGRAHGVGLDDRPTVPARFVPFDEWLPTAGETIVLATKCYDNPEVLAAIPPDTLLVPVQNGFDAELVDRVGIEGVASFVAECLPDRTHTRITRPGELHIGASTDGGSRLPGPADELVGVLDRCGGFDVRRVASVLPFKNTKLMYNAAISPIAAMAGLDNGELLTLPLARRLFFGLIRENYAILSAAAAPLARIGPFHPDTVDAILRVPGLARVMALFFVRSLRGTYCSMAGDLPGGPTEIDNYNGHLLGLAGDAEVPLNRAVHAVAKRVERDGLEPSTRWLREVEAAVFTR